MFRGEEKPDSYLGLSPRVELTEKLVWTYDPAPYVLGQGSDLNLLDDLLNVPSFRLLCGRNQCDTGCNLALIATHSASLFQSIIQMAAHSNDDSYDQVMPHHSIAVTHHWTTQFR